MFHLFLFFLLLLSSNVFGQGLLHKEEELMDLVDHLHYLLTTQVGKAWSSECGLSNQGKQHILTLVESELDKVNFCPEFVEPSELSDDDDQIIFTTDQVHDQHFLLPGSSTTRNSLNISNHTSENDRYHLMNLYTQTNGTYWVNQDNWTTHLSVCDWYGVTCNENKRVIGIELKKNKLEGQLLDDYLPPRLTWLILEGNQLKGLVPSFQHVPSLEVLNLASNHFTGPLPPLTNNTLLKELDVGGNLLTGKILTYSSIGSNLNSLLLGNNQLTGMIPDFELPVLHHLDVGRNWLTGELPVFSHLPALKVLKTHINWLNGTIMHTNFTNLINLNEIWLYENEFTGSIPEFTVNVELRHVYLYNNYFSGPAPQLNTLAALQFLFLSSNKLTGVVPNYENSPLLTHFSIARNKMTGISPHTVATFFGLEVYDVSYNQLNNDACDSLSKIWSRQIILAYNQLGCNLTFIQEVASANYLDLSGNPWIFNQEKDILPQQLLRLRCENCNLEGSFDVWIRRDNDIELYLSGNRFTSIPNLDSSTLKKLDLSNNPINANMEAILPFEELGHLTSLDLSSTGVSGKIPDFLFNLEELLLSNNSLSQGLPINRFSPMRILDLSHNDFADDIPQAFSTYYFLNTLKLTDNYGLRDIPSPNCTDLLPVFLVPDHSPKHLLNYGNYQCPELTLTNTPRSTVNIDPAYYAFSECRCNPGWFGIHASCLSCSSGVQESGRDTFLWDTSQFVDSMKSCPGGQSLQGRYYTGGVFVRDRASCVTESLRGILAPCLRRDSDVDSHPCNPTGDKDWPVSFDVAQDIDELLEDGQWCISGHTGRLCSKCMRGYYPTGNSCSECPDRGEVVLSSVLQVTVLALVITVIVVRVLRRVQRQVSSEGPNPETLGSALRVLTAHLQQLYILFESNELLIPTVISSNWHPSVTTGFKLSTLFTSECVFPHMSRIILSLFATGFAVILASALLGLVKVCGSPNSYITWRRTMGGLLVMLWSYFAVPLISLALQHLGCVDNRGISDSDPNFLNAFPAVACNDEWRVKGAKPAYLLLFVWFGVFVLFCWRLRYVSQRGVYSDSTVARLFGPVIERYRSPVWWWEVVIIARGIAMGSVIAFIPYWESFWQPLAFFMVVQSSAFLQTNIQPYKNRSDNMADLASLYLLLITFFAALLRLPNDTLYAWALCALHILYIGVMLYQVYRQDLSRYFRFCFPNVFLPSSSYISLPSSQPQNNRSQDQRLASVVDSVDPHGPQPINTESIPNTTPNATGAAGDEPVSVTSCSITSDVYSHLNDHTTSSAVIYATGTEARLIMPSRS